MSGALPAAPDARPRGLDAPEDGASFRGEIMATSPLAGPASGAARLGIALMLVGMALFSLNDAIGNWLVSTYSVGQVVLVRSVFALAVLLVLLRGTGYASLLSVERPGVQAARVVFSTAEVFCFYAAVAVLPLADTMTYWLAAPIYVAALSPLLLGERVGAMRWAAILLGFVGVIIALGPTGAVSPLATALALIGSLCFGLMMITGRFLRGTPDRTLVFWQTAGALLAGLAFAPFAWIPPGPADFALLGLLGIVAMLAHLFVTRALKLADATTVAPFQYTLLPWAILFGWLFFGDLPHAAMLGGAAIIVVSGLILFLRDAPPASPHRKGGPR
jgi:drug/metabolite transporter (DMT)-like permease